jgi:hypothetical protein
VTKDEERNRRDGGQRCQGRDVAIYVGDSRYGPFGLDFQQSVASGEVVGFPRFRQGAKAPQCGKRYVRLFATDMTQETTRVAHLKWKHGGCNCKPIANSSGKTGVLRPN